MLKLGTLALSATLAITLVGCDSDEAPTGTVRLALESSGSMPTTIQAVEVKVAGIDVHIAHPDASFNDQEERGSWLSTNYRPETINLLDLKKHMARELGDVMAHGSITQVRLRLDVMDAGRVVMADGRSCPIDASAVDPVGIRVLHPFFQVEPEENGETRIVLNIDVQESLVVVGPCNYKLRPVIRLARVER